MEIFAQEFEPASYFCDWTCIHLGMRRQKSPKFDFQSQFSMSKISFIFLIFFSVKIIRLGEQLTIIPFFDHFIFWYWALFLSTRDQVNASPITKITSWFQFLGKNLHLVRCATVCGKSEVMLTFNMLMKCFHEFRCFCMEIKKGCC